MNKILLPLLLILFCSSLYAQGLNRSKLDSLYNLYVRIHNYNGHYQPQSPQEDTLHTKCSFGVAARIFIHFNEFTESQQKILKILLSRPVTDTSIVSPSGFFRIHYNTVTSPIPQYDVHEFANALDSSYNFEVNYLGYPPPPPDTINGVSPSEAGGDGKYDVYIVNLVGSYGETDFETEVAPGTNRFTSYMQVHYSFGTGFFTHGIYAARVTAAHEFHHSIQAGNYIFRSSDQFFYELTSTSMEEFVFTTVNDYYGYMDEYFSRPDKAFASNSGYDLAIWNIFLKDEYGYNIIKTQWELMPFERAINAINLSLLDSLETPSSFGKELNTFGIWTYFTGERAKPGKYFSEGANYPLINSFTFELNTPLQLAIKPTSNNPVITIVSNIHDTLAAILTNSDIAAGINNLTKNYSATYYLFNYNGSGSTRLDSNYFEKLQVDDATIWLTSVILNGNIIKQDTTFYPPVAENVDYVYPNPFRYAYNFNNIINIPVNGAINDKAELYIYSASMNLIFNKSLQIETGKHYTPIVKWNVDEVGKKVSSGVYIYVTKTKQGKHVGKLVIINE